MPHLSHIAINIKNRAAGIHKWGAKLFTLKIRN